VGAIAEAGLDQEQDLLAVQSLPSKTRINTITSMGLLIKPNTPPDSGAKRNEGCGGEIH
jgi:hypothetical protein